MKNTGRKNIILEFAPFILMAVGLVMFIIGVLTFDSHNSTREMEALRNAINKSITACYAETGSYPENLTSLKNDYDLIYDESRFFVDYVITGSNIRPEVTIIERRKGS